MKIERLENFTRGWVAGDFEPSIIRTKDFEVSVRDYKKGDKQPRHFHKVAKEVTIIVSGKFLINGQELIKGDCAILEPGEAADFECLDDGSNTVIKTPSEIGDKYLAE
jgi:hypothetical protein